MSFLSSYNSSVHRKTELSSVKITNKQKVTAEHELPAVKAKSKDPAAWLGVLWTVQAELTKGMGATETNKELVDIATSITKVAEIARKFMDGGVAEAEAPVADEDAMLKELKTQLDKRPDWRAALKF